MPNVEWSVPFSLTSPQGTLYFNQDADGPMGTSKQLFLMDPSKCLMGPQTLRTTTDDVPQADGGIVHRAFRSLMVAKVAVEFWHGTTPADASYACTSDLRAMWDKMMLHLTALVGPSQAALDNGNCRLRWTPSGSGSDRILDRVQMLGWPTPVNDGVGVSCDFTLQTPYPYAIDLTQTTPTIGATTVITNSGTAPFWPVVEISGPANTFAITNTWPDGSFFFFQYDSTQPGAIPIPAGSHAEIDMFRNTIYLNGNSSNLKAGVVITLSDFWAIAPGANTLTKTGDGTMTLLMNNAWS